MTNLADGLMLARDLSELAALKTPIRPPVDASAASLADTTRRTVQFAPWLYDYDHGWTPERERSDPRPALQVPPYYRARFQLRTSTLAGAKSNFVKINLRSFVPHAAVFLTVPTRILDKKVLAKVSTTKKKALSPTVRVAGDVTVFNKLTGQKARAPISRTQTVLELTSGEVCLLPNLQLTQALDVLEIHYVVSREHVQPKTYYTIQFAQFIDHKLFGKFEHLFQAYHQYDVAVIGDRRTGIAYRRHAAEVSGIPPMALAFFDSWRHAQAAGFDPHPRTFGHHFEVGKVSEALATDILRFFNLASTKPAQIVARIEDNPYVDDHGRTETTPKRKRGIDLKTAERIVLARQKLGRRGFTSLAQIDAVRGVGKDTMSDIIASFIAQRVAPTRAVSKWSPDPQIVSLLAKR